MPRTNSKGRPPLAVVRRFEAAGFRAWPAASVYYDGTWAIRLTAGHPAKRLNSVNPLDPGDVANPAKRIAQAARRFAAYGRPLTFRMSPLSGNALASYLDSEGWSSFAESLVMRVDLENVAAFLLEDLGQPVHAHCLPRFLGFTPGRRDVRRTGRG